MNLDALTSQQVAFIAARRYLTRHINRLFASLRREGLADVSSRYEIYAADGLRVKSHNQYDLEGQQVCLDFQFSHRFKKFSFAVSISNTEDWNLALLFGFRNAYGSECFSGVEIPELDVAFEQVKTTLIAEVEKLVNPPQTKFPATTLSTEHSNAREISPKVRAMSQNWH